MSKEIFFKKCAAFDKRSRFRMENAADCCDGSDEAEVKCKNTCLDQSAGVVHALTDKLNQYYESLKKKSESIQKGIERKEAWKMPHIMAQAVVSKEAEVQAATGERRLANSYNSWLQVFQLLQR